MAKANFSKISEDLLHDLARRFKALSEINRLRIVRALQSGEKSVGALVDLTALSQPNVSRHLTVLTSSGLVGRRKVGTTVLYRIIDLRLSKVCELFCHID